MLHNASNDGGHVAITALAISSDDGATFSKPMLDMRKFGGSTSNNLLPGNAMNEGTQNVWLNPAAKDPTERYVGQHEDATSGEIVLDVSADGLHWRQKSAWNFQGNADSRAEVFFDEWIQRYVLITRNWYFLPTPEKCERGCPHPQHLGICALMKIWFLRFFLGVSRHRPFKDAHVCCCRACPVPGWCCGLKLLTAASLGPTVLPPGAQTRGADAGVIQHSVAPVHAA